MSEKAFQSKETTRIISRQEAKLHFYDVFCLDRNGDPLVDENGKIEKSSYNPSSTPPEIEEDQYTDTDLLIFFRSDDDTLALSTEQYEIFLNQYNIADRSIPPEKLWIDEWNGKPCIRVRTLE